MNVILKEGIFMAKENMTIRMEPELKAQASALFKALGMDLSTATSIFYRQALRCQGLPFEVKLGEPNDETLEAIREVQQMKKNASVGKAYTDVDEMMKELLD